jgi:hypothetical protein
VAGAVVDSCCGPGAQCCAAQAYGYLGADRCVPASEPCPLACPGGAAACPPGNYCRHAPAPGGFACVPSCSAEALCGFNLCCGLGSVCEAGECRMGDLGVDGPLVADTLEIWEGQEFDASSCEIEEGCVLAPGARRLLAFALRTVNIGAADVIIGDPSGQPEFHYSSCHEHDHLGGYTRYRLLADGGSALAAGGKYGFCLMDSERMAEDAPEGAFFDCDHQGIQRGWSDLYTTSQPCQWLDVTGVAAGDYLLEVTINAEGAIVESSFDNNVALVPVTIPPPPE